MKKYEGLLSQQKMEKAALQGYRSWMDQRKKCYNKKNKDYKYYGGKGITVEYSSRDFISWWIENLKTFNGTVPTCSRIDHSKGYSFDNIKMEDRVDNCRERTTRLGSPGKGHTKPTHIKSVYLISKKTKEDLILFKTQSEASKCLGIPQGAISNICVGKAKSTREGFCFRFA